jgi:hypothetical protein
MVAFEIHLENWGHALHLSDRGHISPLRPLLDLLANYEITPKVFLLDDAYEDYFVDIYKYGLNISLSHGVHHYYDEKADRSPYFNQEGQPGLCGGFFFRVLPLWLLKREVLRTGLFYIHPHDIDEHHPIVKNPILNCKRQWGTKGALKKLEKLIQTGIFGN